LGAFQEAFAAFGVPITEAEARASMGRGKLDHVRDIGAVPAVAERWSAAHDGAVFTEAEAEACRAEGDRVDWLTLTEARVRGGWLKEAPDWDFAFFPDDGSRAPIRTPMENDTRDWHARDPG